MDRILPATRRWPLYSAATSRQIETEAGAAAGAAGEPRLMVRAGIAIARLAAAIAPFADRIWIAAGPGNNGGDGIEAAIHLQQQGRRITLSLVGDPARLPPDAAASLRTASEAGLAVVSGLQLPPPLGATDLVVDALLGLGSSRAPEGQLATTIDAINAQRCAVLAIDLPTGIDADCGRLLGSSAIRATDTLSLLTLKPGLFTGLGREYAGTIWFDNLATASSSRPADAWLSGPTPPAAHGKARRHGQHKGSFGDVVVVAGARGMAGAALLCARAAHAAGAGRVWVAPLDAEMPLLDLARPELMWVPIGGGLDPDMLSHMTAVAGCGGGEAIADQLPALLQHAARLVIDADGLNAIAREPTLRASLRQRSDRGLPTILTPHPLEAARLLASSTHEVQQNRLRAAQQLADRDGVAVVLKGSGSVIAAPGHIAHVNSSGGPALATAGSGDVLAGWLGGSWGSAAANAAGPGGAAIDLAFGAACDAVWWHGAAADASPLNLLRAGDLIEVMTAAPAA